MVEDEYRMVSRIVPIEPGTSENELKHLLDEELRGTLSATLTLMGGEGWELLSHCMAGLQENFVVSFLFRRPRPS